MNERCRRSEGVAGGVQRYWVSVCLSAQGLRLQSVICTAQMDEWSYTHTNNHTHIFMNRYVPRQLKAKIRKQNSISLWFHSNKTIVIWLPAQQHVMSHYDFSWTPSSVSYMKKIFYQAPTAKDRYWTGLPVLVRSVWSDLLLIFLFAEWLSEPAGLFIITLDCWLRSMFLVLLLFLTLPVSNCEGQLQFSLFSWIKTMMVQKWLIAFSVIVIGTKLRRN